MSADIDDVLELAVTGLSNNLNKAMNPTEPC